MRQEQINTFNGGLVYDLNPLVTPNSVLTDAVNGTFITFNGNELSLQNDAGNTVINVKNIDEIETYNNTLSYSIGTKVSTTDSTNKIRCWICVVATSPGQSPTTAPGKWQEYIVRLSPGFYPLAVKEYGGVLYIVSARNILQLFTYYQPGQLYSKDEVVRAALDYINEGVVGHFYISLKYNNTDDIQVTSSWRYLGPLEQAMKFNEVEFGSYPSPEGANEDDGSEETIIFNATHLEITRILNDKTFAAGSSINFATTLTVGTPEVIGDPGPPEIIGVPATFGMLDYISRPGDIRFYNVELFQQISSGGMQDLTSYINGSYTGETHWLFDPTFRFYNPFAYKGKLAIRISITLLKSFTVSPGIVTYNPSTDEYTVTFLAKASFDPSSFSIGVSGFTLTSNLGTITPGTPTIVGGDIQQQIVISGIAGDKVGEILIYTVVPIFTWEGIPQDSADLPISYVQRYIINGTLPILDQSYSIIVSTDPVHRAAPGPNGTVYAQNMCILPQFNPELYGYRSMTSLPIINVAGEYVDMNFQVTNIPHVLQLDNYPNEDPNVEIIATFMKDTNYIITDVSWEAAYLDPIYTINKAIVRRNAIGKSMMIYDPTCLESNLTVNIEGQINVTMTVTQDGRPTQTVVGNTGTFGITTGLNAYLTITPDTYAFEIITDVIAINQASTYKYILIGKLKKQTINTGEQIVAWNSNMAIPETMNVGIIYQDPQSNYYNSIMFQGELRPNNDFGYPQRVLYDPTDDTPKLFTSNITSYTMQDLGHWDLFTGYRNTQNNPSDYVLYGVYETGMVAFRQFSTDFI
jgi:hypothetical protein